MAAVPKAASRRIPPPCWSDDETAALIDVYRDKWYSLRRGNLRAPDWQEVADAVAARCTLANPPKTSVQCRHKMEKLRKRYRAEIQRIGNTQKGHRVPSSWVHFNLMDSMELGTCSSDPRSNHNDEEAEIEDDLMLYPQTVTQDSAIRVNRRIQGSIATGVRIKMPNFAAGPSPIIRGNGSFEDLPPPMRLRYGSGEGSRNGYSKEVFGGERGEMKRKVGVEKNDGNVLVEMVEAIQKLGDGFMKMEKMKMDMARELETMRMKTEIEQTEVILEIQQKMWESFSETVMEKKNKKMKRMQTPEP